MVVYTSLLRGVAFAALFLSCFFPSPALAFLVLTPDSLSPTRTRRLKMAKNNRNNNNRQKKKTKQPPQPEIVGPDGIQVLQGTLFHKQVALILCGESHEDAIDVTRRGGRFLAKEGWIEVNKLTDALIPPSPQDDNDDDDDELLVFRILAHTKKSLPVEKSKEWAEEYLEDHDGDDETTWANPCVMILWVKDAVEAKVTKGKGYLLEFAYLDKEDLEDDDEEGQADWIICASTSTTGGDSATTSPRDGRNHVIQEWVQQQQQQQADDETTTWTAAVLSGRYRAFEWGDLDSEAHQLNKRKEDRRKENNIWTWDDWFAYIRATNNNNVSDDDNGNDDDDDVAVHLVLEASVPPWELDLHRPKFSSQTDDIIENNFQLPPAAECIRCVEEDEEESIDNEVDPSSDGVGSYIDYIYRRFMEEMVQENKGNPMNVRMQSTWVHCVETRDLGSQEACHCDSVKETWKDLLLKDEIESLFQPEDKQEKPSFQGLEADSTKEFIKFVPECRMNPERQEFEKMKSQGLLTVDDEEDLDDDDDEFTFPSFESFFGQNTDFLYYTPHMKLSYSPFLAKCVGSLSNWEKLFTNLFLGGTIPEALSVLDLENFRGHLYVRSPILKSWNPDTSSYEYQYRDDGDHYITNPFFPFIFYLTARASSPPRTWSSQLYARLFALGTDDEEHTTTSPLLENSTTKSSSTCCSPKELATAAREWTLESIRRHSADPKGSDDSRCGGEWFEAFLRATHRDIYDDIDLSDSSVLLRKNYMKSEEHNGRKHNIGKIQIPSCQDGFDEILERFGMDVASPSEIVVTPRVEVMAKILIDIWMSNLIDFSTVLKVAEVVSDAKGSNVAVVCYMGSAHTRKVAEFYINRMGFKKKTFVGKLDWDDNEPHTLKLPSYMWNISEMF